MGLKKLPHTIRFLLVGCGAIGTRHAHLASEKGKLLAVCDTDEKKVKTFSKRYQCYGYTSLSEMLLNESADVLIVCTPNGLHAVHSIAGLKRGLHVLCEKPMALSVSDCRRMILASAKAQKHLLIVKQNRFNPPVTAVKKLLDQQKLGKIYSIHLNGIWNRPALYYQHSDWRGTKALDGGVLFTQFSHFIDLLYWFFGDVKFVNGFIKNAAHQTASELEDTGVFSFVTKQNIPGTLHYSINSCIKNYEGSVTILAEKATIKIGGPYLNCIEYQEPELIPVHALNKSGAVNDYKGYQGSMNNHARVYDEFLQVISGKQKQYVSGTEGMHSVKIIEKFYKAAR